MLMVPITEKAYGRRALPTTLIHLKLAEFRHRPVIEKRVATAAATITLLAASNNYNAGALGR